MESFFGNDPDERKRKLCALAGKVYRDTLLLSDLEPSDRIIESLDDLQIAVEFFRIFGAKIVLTMGTFDLIHVGHARYIRKACGAGSLLVVGVDDDVKAKGRKGENRPAVPYTERSEMLTYLRYADIVVKKAHDQPKWEMIKTVRPNVLIAVVGTYSPEELVALKEFCGEVVVLDRQAQTSTSHQIRKMILEGADDFGRRIHQAITEKLPAIVTEVYEGMKK